MKVEAETRPKTAARQRADELKAFRCKNLIVVIEDPSEIRNIGTVIRNANALGAERVYIIDPRKKLPNDWADMRGEKALSSTSVSGVKWTFVKRFDSTEACLAHLERNGFVSIVTSPHVKGRTNILLSDGDYTAHHKLAVWFGNESRGISALAVEHSDMCVSVPMFGMIESLNLATSSGIVLYEVTRQRRAYQSVFSRRDRKGRRETPLPLVMDRDAP